MTAHADHSKQTKGNLFISIAFMASIFFAISNWFQTKLASKVGNNQIFYTAPGLLLASIIYNGVQIYLALKSGSKYSWGLIQNGKVNKVKMLAFVAMGFVQVCVLNLIMLTINSSVMANVNTGLITSVFSVTPFFSALLDQIFFNLRLSCTQMIGIVFVFLSLISLSLRSAFYPI